MMVLSTIEQGVDALEQAKQSEASLNNLLELEDKDDELLLQWEENKATKSKEVPDKGQPFEFDLLSDTKGANLIDDELVGLDMSPTKESSEAGDSPARFSAQWNKLFGQEPANIHDANVPDLKLDSLGQLDDDFGSFFSATTKVGSEEQPKGSSGAILPSQLFDLDQSLFSQQSPRSPHDLLSDFPMPSPARPSTVQKQIDQKESRTTMDLMSELQLDRQETSSSSSAVSSSLKPMLAAKAANKDMSQWFSLFADLDPLANPDAIGKTTKEADPNCYS